jgi:hypothetical protein
MGSARPMPALADLSTKAHEANERTVFRCLGVPDMIADQSKSAAAALLLATAAGLDVSADPNVSRQSKLSLYDASQIISRALQLLAAGALDAFVVRFNYRDDDWYVSQLTRHTKLEVDEQGEACARALVERLRSCVVAHPFEGGTGRPFS